MKLIRRGTMATFCWSCISLPMRCAFDPDRTQFANALMALNERPSQSCLRAHCWLQLLQRAGGHTVTVMAIQRRYQNTPPDELVAALY
jgi:hypothetical protein